MFFMLKDRGRCPPGLQNAAPPWKDTAKGGGKVGAGTAPHTCREIWQGGLCCGCTCRGACAAGAAAALPAAALTQLTARDPRLLDKEAPPVVPAPDVSAEVPAGQAPATHLLQRLVSGFEGSRLQLLAQLLDLQPQSSQHAVPIRQPGLGAVADLLCTAAWPLPRSSWHGWHCRSPAQFRSASTAREQRAADVHMRDCWQAWAARAIPPVWWKQHDAHGKALCTWMGLRV